MMWQPINTVPEDDEPILAYFGNSKSNPIAIVHRPDHESSPNSYRCVVDDQYYLKPPTHWMPLPTKPTK